MSSKKKTKITRNAQGQFAPTNAVVETEAHLDDPIGPAENADRELGMAPEAEGVEGETPRDGTEGEAIAPDVAPPLANAAQGDGVPYRPESRNVRVM